MLGCSSSVSPNGSSFIQSYLIKQLNKRSCISSVCTNSSPSCVAGFPRCLSIPVTMRALNGKLDKRMIPQTPPARVTPLAGATPSVLVSLDAVSPSVTEPGRVQSPPSATISQSVPGADAMAAVSASEYYLMSVTASQPVSDSNTSLPANPYPCVSVGVCPSHWIASSNHLPELI